MTVIDWESKPEPWRSIGRKFAKECQKIMAGYAEPRDKPIAPHVLAGYRLADYRVSRGMTQRMLAERSGYDLSTIQAIENGRRQTSKKSRQDLADTLNVPVEKIWF